MNLFSKSNVDAEKKFFNQLVKNLKIKLENWKSYRSVRGIIDDFFKLIKKSFDLRKVHHYTEKSMAKFICLGLLLGGLVVSLGMALPMFHIKLKRGFAAEI